MARQWYIRNGGPDIGPISSDELRDLASLEAIGKTTEVSHDRNQWVAAAKVSGLQFGGPPARRSKSAKAPSLPASQTTIFSNSTARDTESTKRSQWPLTLMMVLFVSAVRIYQRETSASPPNSPTGSSRAPAVRAVEAPPIVAPTVPPKRVQVSWFDGTQEFLTLLGGMSDQEKILFGLSSIITGDGVIAAHVLITNTGSDAVFISPQNLRIHVNDEVKPGMIVSVPKSLQQQFLQPGSHAEGLALFTVTLKSARAYHQGSKKLSYQDPAIVVTYP